MLKLPFAEMDNDGLSLNDLTPADRMRVQLNKGKTALHLAAHVGEDEIAKILLGDSGIRNLQDCNGWTALHWAVDNEHENTVRTLLDAGVDAGVHSFDACTPLDIAEVGGLKTMEQMLRKALAARNRPTVGGAPP
ncbi:F-box domain and ankyrin repeat protein [Penicillium coprophilum]|uniref:F-box domain and ankyrin repeat protein n=1 Tax=Penicillium coprophilum TaxID=36646 RepID=UPI002385C997|nr:F-box domain and ankyrin repeat protein [Penicillium coprophilum]KAJ5159046.1 F-box domain and ankyrin repeat protein [Penicillium coprophilum]